MPRAEARVAERVLLQPPAHPLKHLSWSGIQAFNQCPRKFAFRYIEKASAERTSAALIFGTAIHRAAIEEIHAARLEGKAPPTHEQLLAAYDEVWADESKEKQELCFAKGEDRQFQRELAGRMLAAYQTHLAAQQAVTEVLAIEEAAFFQILAEAPPIKARLDLVERQGQDLVITDLKTARCRWNEAKTREHLPQLIVYAHAALPILRALGARRIRPRFVVLTKAKAPAVQVLEPEAGPGDVARLKDLVSETWHAIQARAYPRREGWACAGCEFRVRCLGR